MNDDEAVSIPGERIERRIFRVRSLRVILDTDLAELYGVTTGALNQAVSRNEGRFPPDFAFRLESDEWANLKSHFVTSSWGGRRGEPRAFTEHGALMVANVLKSPRAIRVSIERELMGHASEREGKRIGFHRRSK